MTFPGKFPESKPRDFKLSPAMNRLYDFWGSWNAVGNEFYSRFKYSEPMGFPDDGFISRRDPSKIIRVKEERGPALRRSPDGRFGCRSLSTPDILPWKGRFYLYVQVYSDVLENDACPVSVAVSDNPEGPFELKETVLIPQGKPGSWDENSIHDPYALPYKGKVYLYYKGHPKNHLDPRNLRVAQGLAIGDSPEGPFKKHSLNPLLNSGHETMFWPYREGIASLQSRDGNEGNTVQFAADGIDFDLKSIVDMPPHAGGPYIPDLESAAGDGKGIHWGLCFSNTGSDVRNRSFLLRFDCSLNRDFERPGFKDSRSYVLDQYRAFPLSGDEKAALRSWEERGSLDTD